MPQVDIKKPASPVRRTVAVGIALTLIVGVVAVALVIKLWPKPTVKTTQTTLQTAENKRFEGDTDGAITDLKKQLAVARTNGEKLNLNLALGGAYESKQNYSQALQYYQAAGKLKVTYSTNNAIARAAASAGNTKLAKDYYTRNRELINSGGAPQHMGDLPEVEDALKQLEGK